MHERPIFRLRVLHRQLDREIDVERSRRMPDGLRILRLKKLKLAIKDRLARADAPQPQPA